MHVLCAFKIEFQVDLHKYCACVVFLIVPYKFCLCPMYTFLLAGYLLPSISLNFLRCGVDDDVYDSFFGFLIIYSIYIHTSAFMIPSSLLLSVNLYSYFDVLLILPPYRYIFLAVCDNDLTAKQPDTGHRYIFLFLYI